MRRRRTAQDSLELFLDAICNMFGGFVFLMLFVVISTRATSEKAIEESIEESRMSAAQFASLELELEDLQEKWSAVSKMIEESRDYVESLTSPEILATRRETLQTLEELQEAAQENAEKLAREARIERRATELDAALKTAERELQAAEQARESAGKDAERRRAAAARATAPPQMRFSLWRKTEVAVILKYGRLYFWHKNVDTVRTLNSDDFYVVEEELGYARTEPRIDRGVDLLAPGVEKRLDAAFAPYSAASHSIAIVVASDSYPEFGLVRDYLKERLFEIRPMIGKKGTDVVDRGGSNARTQ